MLEPERVDGLHTIGANRVRLLRDGKEAFPAMLDAINHAQREVMLEMYWVGNDAVGIRFRDALVARARQGVEVYVTYDGVGSLGLFRAFWAPLIRAGGRVLENGPVAPWRRRFRLLRLPFRDHRKILVVDGERGFCGGLNLAIQWLPLEQGGGGWRDDVIELRGPAALELRAIACEVWWRNGSAQPATIPAPPLEPTPRLWVLANRIAKRPNRRIRRTYLLAIRRAHSSIDITNPYFLPGPLFLHALRAAHDRGVRVRLLVPGISDVWLVDLAMREVVDKLARYGIAVYSYGRSVLHAKTAVLDQRVVVCGSHNLDAFSWRFDLEANVVVDDLGFASEVTRSFEHDLRDASRLDTNVRRAPLLWGLVAWLATRFRTYL
ncbi:MAG TPA: phospholipase D-like domain-containing protein [Polyangiaceae bacterium]